MHEVVCRLLNKPSYSSLSSRLFVKRLCSERLLYAFSKLRLETLLKSSDVLTFLDIPLAPRQPFLCPYLYAFDQWAPHLKNTKCIAPLSFSLSLSLSVQNWPTHAKTQNATLSLCAKLGPLKNQMHCSLSFSAKLNRTTN